MKKLQKDTLGNLKGMLRYAKKKLDVPLNPKVLDKPAPNKTYAPNIALKATIIGLLTNCTSGTAVKKRLDEVNASLGRVSSPARTTISNLLDEHRTVDWLDDRLLSFLDVLKRMRLLKTCGRGMAIAYIDGIDLGEVHEGGGHCDLCLKRKHSNGDKTHFHKIIVISVETIIGPVPIYKRFVRPEDLSVNHGEVSEEKFKEDCELSCAKAALLDLAGNFGGKLPFRVLASDSLYANAPFMELIESLGAIGVFVFNQERRNLYKQAKADFSGKTFGFDVHKENWKTKFPQPRAFEAKWSIYNDTNRKADNKKVRVFETERTEEDGTKVKGMAITSDDPVITPQLVEQLRFGKWNNLENGVFNELTNNWGTLKHIFVHKTIAIQSMVSLQLICLVIALLYRFRNLNRGGRKYKSTLKEFLGKMLSDLKKMGKVEIIELFCTSPPRSTS